MTLNGPRREWWRRNDHVRFFNHVWRSHHKWPDERQQLVSLDGDVHAFLIGSSSYTIDKTLLINMRMQNVKAVQS